VPAVGPADRTARQSDYVVSMEPSPSFPTARAKSAHSPSANTPKRGVGASSAGRMATSTPNLIFAPPQFSEEDGGCAANKEWSNCKQPLAFDHRADFSSKHFHFEWLRNHLHSSV
jgi:hypothetical protein